MRASSFGCEPPDVICAPMMDDFRFHDGGPCQARIAGEQGVRDDLVVVPGCVVVGCSRLGLAVRGRGQPGQIRREPRLHPAGVRRRPRCRSGKQLHGVDDFRQIGRVDDAAGLAIRLAGQSLRVLHRRCHFGRGIEKPGVQDRGRFRRVRLVAAEVIRIRQFMRPIDHVDQIVFVGNRVRRRIAIAVANRPGQPVRLFRVRPRVDRRAQVIATIAVGRQLLLHGHRWRRHRQVAIGAAQQWRDQRRNRRDHRCDRGFAPPPACSRSPGTRPAGRSPRSTPRPRAAVVVRSGPMVTATPAAATANAAMPTITAVRFRTLPNPFDRPSSKQLRDVS